MSIERFDALLESQSKAAAIVLRRRLRPVEGDDAPIFPPTFAPSESADQDEGEGTGGRYQIDELPGDPRRNVCLIDSVGSQANRMEPIFKQADYAMLVPQITIRMGKGCETNLLDLGHRAADAAVRFSKSYGPALFEAFGTYNTSRDCTKLLQIAPTSLVFGVWDSRATGAKIQRIVRSVIRAYNVEEIKRSATYRAACDYTENGLINPEQDKGSGKNNPLSQEGFKFSLATETHGGIFVRGEIVQQAALNLVALRALSGDMQVKRYLFGLALVALSHIDASSFNLREGCLLCAASNEDFVGIWKIVNIDGSEDTKALFTLTTDKARDFAISATQHVDLTKPTPDTFDADTANGWLAIDKKVRKKLAKSEHPAKALANKQADDEKKRMQKSGTQIVSTRGSEDAEESVV